MRQKSRQRSSRGRVRMIVRAEKLEMKKTISKTGSSPPSDLVNPSPHAHTA